MSTPSAGVEGAVQHAAADADMEDTSDIPRRLMKVKVLYTFDDQNKSNCLARLPNALSIPTVSLDETTQVGVIELKTCIQAIVAASPELVAKLGHDFTVYAYDYSEYETPLVGQGMLSWILASASNTPNAPAGESQTMVTGRVCKNILGLFSNGVKETLEVKLKLVPVPTSMQSEYVENMERYHSLSKIMPDGMDYKEWAEFLKANPAIGQLAQPTPTNAPPMSRTTSANAIESFNDMLMNNSFYSQNHTPFSTHDTRPSSPAMSTISSYPYHMYSETRPASQASFHSEPAAHSPYYQSTLEPQPEQSEEGPAKKRARVTKAKRPKKTALGPNVESLRVTASTAASVRLHRPTPMPVGTSVSAEQVPRAPTPRPFNPRRLQHGSRAPSQSLLRNGSMDEGRPFVSPYDSGIFSDNAVDSADDDKGDSPGDTPHLPSSPPMLPGHAASPAPSSPELPMLPPPNDSGFASDMPVAHIEAGTGRGRKPSVQSDAPTEPEVRTRKRPDRSKRAWSECKPGPVDLLPTSSAPMNRPGAPKRSPGSKPIDTGVLNHFLKHLGSQNGVAQSVETSMPNSGLPHMETAPLNRPVQDTRKGPSPPVFSGATVPSVLPNETARADTPNLPLSAPKAARGLARSLTWSGEPMSDAVGPDDGNDKQPRSGSGAKRKQAIVIKEKLDKAINKGMLPTFCNNCGQIETPCWRRAFTRIMEGTPDNIVVSSKGTGIVAYEVIDGTDTEPPRYRLFKQALEPEEIEQELFKALVLCNPCGLWLLKKNAMRPQEIWGKASKDGALQGQGDKRKRRRNKPKTDNDLLTSDAVLPESELGMSGTQLDGESGPMPDRPANDQMKPPSRPRSESVQISESSKFDQPTARAALMRAFQSSPVGVRGTSRDAPQDLTGDLTPRPTRRLLFPSPRRPGEMKSLADNKSSQSPSPRSVTLRENSAASEDGDKENCPPPAEHGDDDFAHLFESPKVTPTKGSSLEDFLKTPTPGSRQRVALTPMRLGEVNLTTPSRSSRTPRGNGRAAVLAPETPFTRQLNDLLSDSMLAGSPSQAFDLSAFPTFNTPDRNESLHFGDFLQNDTLSSDLPVPSSPPKNLDFSVFEDPNTSTAGLWSGASIFELNGPIMSDTPFYEQHQGDQDTSAEPRLLTINGMNLDFTAMIDEVVGNGHEEQDGPPRHGHEEHETPGNGHYEHMGTPNFPVESRASASVEPAGPTRQKTVTPSDRKEKRDLRLRCQRCKNQKKGCDGQRPCTRCVKAGLDINSCVLDGGEPAPLPCQRCRQLKKICDLRRPCTRCVRGDLGMDACIYDGEPAQSPAYSAMVEPSPRPPPWQPQTKPNPSIVPADYGIVSGEEARSPAFTEASAATPSAA